MTTIGLFRNDENAVAVEAGQVIFQQGDVMYVILEGQISISSHDKIIDTLGEGEIFGEMALVDDSPRSADAVVVSQGKVVPVRGKLCRPYVLPQVVEFLALFESHFLTREREDPQADKNRRVAKFLHECVVLVDE